MTTLKHFSTTLLIVAVVALSFLVSGNVMAQSNLTSAAAPTIMPLQVTAIDAYQLRSVVDKEESFIASYPGGEQQVKNFLKAHVEYPELARENNFEGTTIVRFKVLEDGSLGQFIVKQSTHDICDQAVIKALQEMGEWTPAKLRGKTVASWRAVAVDFSMTL